ncbi:hypothetical protein CON18_14650 [Bacillus cereus]|uniref:hypothetical protein n=1 Tax=Bacillus cereus TaxID=1396 RepID=UPI000BEBEF1A|nr:hypothetical protein [Bacillus cereus]PDZ39471.1 hypothetical protein CON18_14650 [Bacillus cereus]PGN82773.1 hypothetical protein CN963_17965 [Bacillus cereus]
MSKDWIKRAKKNLLKKSVEKEDFPKARKEWQYKGLEDNEYCEAECELCNHEEIRYEYIIKNKLNNNIMIVGSKCIQKFTDDFKTDFFDTEGNLVNEQRLTKDKKAYLKEVLHKALDKRLATSNSEFYKNIAKTIKKDGKLTPNQLKCLHNFYPTLDDMGQRAFKSIVKVRLRKEKEQEQLKNLSLIDLEFVAQFMTSSQRKTHGISNFK